MWHCIPAIPEYFQVALGYPLFAEEVGSTEKYSGMVGMGVCFLGVTGYRSYLKYVAGVVVRPDLGLQPRDIGPSRVFVVPNPSPANAAYSLDVLVGWYRRLKELRDGLKRT